MKAAIVVDDYKVERFQKMLIDAGFVSTVGKGVTEDTKVIYVYYQNSQLENLKSIVQKAELIATATKNKN